MLEVDPPTDPSLWSDHLFFRLDRLIEQLLKSDTRTLIASPAITPRSFCRLFYGR
jgi:hypothetical protein